MLSEKFQFLCLQHLPARFNAQETAWYMGFSAQDIPHLTKRKFLKAAGDPGPKATKSYSYAQLRRLHDSDPWVHKASASVHKHNRDRSLKSPKDKKPPRRKS